MGLIFLAPLFLLGLAAVALPVLIHLTQRTKPDPIRFPSLMFLSQVPYRTVRRQRIRHWLVFLLRAAAVILLVLAFARPLLDSSAVGGLGGTEAREVVIALDRSYSMAYGGRWERALDAARDVVERVGPDDRATVILFENRAEAATPVGADAATLRAAIGGARVSAGRTRYGPPLQLASQILSESRLPQREVVLITDFQRVGWDGEDDVQLPEGSILTRVNVADGETANLAIVGVSLERSFRSGRELVAVLARVMTSGEPPEAEVVLDLEIEGRRESSQPVVVGPSGSATVRFAEVPIPQRAVRAVVRATADALPVDNQFHFTLSRAQTLSVLVLEHPNAGAGESLYLERALGIGTVPPYRVDVKRVTQFAAGDLNGRAAVILNDAPYPRGAAGRRLQEFVRSGGGILAILGPRSTPNAWPNDRLNLLPGTLGPVVDRLRDRGATLSITDYDHPVFEVFRTPGSGDFSQPRVFRYRRIEESGLAQVLARFDDGGLALGERSVGEGSVLSWASDATASWNDLPVQPVFLPFVHQAIKYLARYQPQRPWYGAGELLSLADHVAEIAPAGAAGAPDEVEVVVEAPSGERIVQRVGEESYLELAEQGFYSVRLGGGDRLESSLAVNVDARESDLTPLDGEELASAVLFNGGVATATDLAATLTPADRERRQGLWWYLLLIVLLILAVESALANRVSRAAR